MLIDSLVHERLRKTRLVDFVVSKEFASMKSLVVTVSGDPQEVVSLLIAFSFALRFLLVSLMQPLQPIYYSFITITVFFKFMT